MVVGLLGLALWALWLEPRRIRLVHRRVELPGWPDRLEDLRVAVIADVHAGSPHVDERKLEWIVESVNSEAPDLVALVGDYVDPEVRLGKEIPPEAVASLLGRLRAPLGVVAVLGNHDWRHYGERVPTALRDAGITVLVDDAVQATDQLWVIGLSDATTGSPAIDASIEQVPEQAAILALSHDPDVFPRMPERVALTLSGHLHGGQVGLPLIRGKVAPSRYGERFIGGHVEEEGRHLFVSRGIGTSTYPVRFLARPEVVVLRLRSVRAS